MINKVKNGIMKPIGKTRYGGIINSIIAVGYPAEEKRVYSENELLHDKIHYNGY